MSNETGGDNLQPFLRRRMTRSVGLVLVGTAAFMLGMPGCDDRGSTRTNATSSGGNYNRYDSGAGPNSYAPGNSATRPSRGSSYPHYLYTGGRRTTPSGWSSSSSSYRSGSGSGSGSRSSSSVKSHTSRGGFGSTGRHVAS
jgi:hypothetical protein